MPTISASVYEELKRAGDIECVGVALARFSESLSPEGQFKLEGGRWIYGPLKFVTFHVQQRAPIIVVTFSGHPAMFKDNAEKAGLSAEWLKLGHMREYSVYKIDHPSQLLAASQFIKWGFEYRTRRRRKTLVTDSTDISAFHKA